MIYSNLEFDGVLNTIESDYSTKNNDGKSKTKQRFLQANGFITLVIDKNKNVLIQSINNSKSI